MGNDLITFANIKIFARIKKTMMRFWRQKPEVCFYRLARINPFSVCILLNCIPIFAIIIELSPVA